MTKTNRTAQRKRSAAMKKRLAAIVAKLESVLGKIKDTDTNDAENLRTCLEDAKAHVLEGIEFYCTFL